MSTAENTAAPAVRTDADKVRETFFATVKTALLKNGSTTWGVVESMEVIKDLVELNENETLGWDYIKPYIQEVVNPNQFANKLEAKGKIERVKMKGRSRTVDISGL